ncbi:YceD family protein [Alloiococcus sp. CFN-8]|uniref:YceD family protein n=1 Tax=Alloiococcus sp. CFN-8 TaxID=3416081 RepID=UPI003CEACA14
MKLDIKELLKRKNFTKNIDEIFQSDSFLYNSEEIKFLSPIKAKGKVSVKDNLVVIDMEASTTLELTCTRCLDRYNSDITINIFEEYSQDTKQENTDVTIITEDYIDLLKVIKDNIIVSLPIKKLCGDSCKGLCQNCGVNLNHEQCKCSKNDVDIRMAKLKDLFLSDKEV